MTNTASYKDVNTQNKLYFYGKKIVTKF